MDHKLAQQRNLPAELPKKQPNMDLRFVYKLVDIEIVYYYIKYVTFEHINCRYVLEHKW